MAEIESKVERCNLQQIHNGKELLSEIQNLNSELSFKLENLNPNSEIPPSLIRGIDDKIQSLLESNVDKEEYVKHKNTYGFKDERSHPKNRQNRKCIQT